MSRVARWAGLHAYAGGLPATGFAARRIPSADPAGYMPVLRAPLAGAQAIGTIAAGGAATISTGPQGLGTIWYPAQVVIATTTGASDASTCRVFLGPQGTPLNLQVGQSYAGGGDVIALSPAPVPVGWFLFAVWAGGHPGDRCSMNVLGVMDAMALQSW